MDAILIECSKDCSCNQKCNNFGFTSGQIQFRTEIDHFIGKGFGVRIKDYMPKGTFSARVRQKIQLKLIFLLNGKTAFAALCF
jgi:hypothetical protein